MVSRTVFALFLMFAVAGCSGGGGKSSAPAVTRHSETSTFLPPIYPGTTVAPLPSTSSTTPTSSVVVGAPHSFPGDGTFKVGVDIPAGTYRSGGAQSCYWERLRGLSGTRADTIENGAGDWPQVVQIMPSDVAFKTQQCPTWVPSTAATTTSSSKAPVTLPPGAQACPVTAAPSGGLTTSAVGSSGTTCPFAEVVRLAYAAGGPVSTAPRQVDAVSPVTKQHYSMTCAANGALVVCNGGDDAVVYLY